MTNGYNNGFGRRNTRNNKTSKKTVRNRVRNACQWCGHPLHRLACTCEVCLLWDCPNEDHTKHPDSPRCPQSGLWDNAS